MCSICMDNFDTTLYNVVTNCGHVFHEKCLRHWFQMDGPRCPICRGSYYTYSSRIYLQFNSDYEATLKSKNELNRKNRTLLEKYEMEKVKVASLESALDVEKGINAELRSPLDIVKIEEDSNRIREESKCIFIEEIKQSHKAKNKIEASSSSVAWQSFIGTDSDNTTASRAKIPKLKSTESDASKSYVDASLFGSKTRTTKIEVPGSSTNSNANDAAMLFEILPEAPISQAAPATEYDALEYHVLALGYDLPPPGYHATVLGYDRYITHQHRNIAHQPRNNFTQTTQQQLNQPYNDDNRIESLNNYYNYYNSNSRM